jgi:TolA-binding protein
MSFNAMQIQEQNKLAKKLVEHKLAANVSDALQQISGHDEVKEEVVEITPVRDDNVNEKKLEVVKVENANDKLAELDNKVKRLNDFFNQFRDVVNKNFKELDEKLNSLKSQKAVAAASAQQQQSGSSSAAAKKPEMRQKADPDNFTEDQFSIEKFFSNSGNKMSGKK